MKPVSHPTNTRTLQAPRGWDQDGVPVEALGITDQLIHGLPFVWSFWEPDAAERASIASGGKVVLSLLGRSMPPAMVMVECQQPVEKTWSDLLQAVAETPSMRAAFDVLVERQRQIDAEGWTAAHDDEHVNDEIAAMACFYAMPSGAREWSAKETGYGDTLGEAMIPEGWVAKAKDGDRRRELVKAAALVIAEIERLDRTAPQAAQSAKGG